MVKAAAVVLCALALAAQENPVKAQLKAGKPVIGATISVPSVDVAVQAASLGFDFLWIEMEHSPITLESAHNIVMATRGSGTLPFIRVPVNETFMAKRALDAGAMGVIFPFTSTPELARQAVAACKYPPAGRRGYGPSLASLRWPSINYADFADQNAMVIVIIEEARAVDQIEEIAAVPGIDVLFIGTSDLSFSLGLRGGQDDPKHKEAIAKVLAAGRKFKVPVGRPGTTDQIPELLKQGFTFFQGATELRLMGDGARPLLEKLGKVRKPAEKPTSIY